MRLAFMPRASAASLICLVCILAIAPPAGAAAIVFNDGGIHTVNTDISLDVNNAIEVRGITTANVTAGAVIGSTGGSSVSTFDTSLLNLSGGKLNDELFLFDNSSANITGGEIDDDITTGGSSIANIHSVIVNDDLEANTNSSMNVFGGSFDEDVEASDFATINLHGGMFQTGTDGANIEAGDNSVINFHGGTSGVGHTDAFGYIGAVGNGKINIYGGSIAGQPEGLLAEDNGVINVYGFSGGQPASINTSGNGKIIFHDGPLTNLAASGPGIILAGTDGSLASITAEDSSVLRIWGHSFKAMNGAVNLPYGPISFAGGSLSGVLADGTAFTNVPFSRILDAVGSTRGVIILTIPEPGTLAVVSIALTGLMVVGRCRSVA